MSLTCSSARKTVALAAISAARRLAGARLEVAGLGVAGFEAGLAAWLRAGFARRKRPAFHRGTVVGFGGQAHAQRPAGDPHLLKVLEQLGRHALRQVDQAVVAADVDAADVTRFQFGLVGDRADDVARLDAMLVADVDAKGLLAELGFATRGMLA